MNPQLIINSITEEIIINVSRLPLILPVKRCAIKFGADTIKIINAQIFCLTIKQPIIVKMSKMIPIAKLCILDNLIIV
mgnify:CR=1 FL=1